jgi:signal transduction histidine kinase
MLHEFIVANRELILSRSRSKLVKRHIPAPTEMELKHGLPIFLDQLTNILRAAKGRLGSERVGDPNVVNVSASAALYGGELLRLGVTVGQLVQDYGSICQSVTELAVERNIAITAEEFRIFNHCLDDAIAQAVTEYERLRDQASGADSGVAQLGFLAHEMRNLLMTSILTFDALAKGSVGIHGSTGTLLGRSLRRMRALVDRTLTDVRLEVGIQQPERVSIARLVEEIEVIATIEANEQQLQLAFDAGASDVAVEADYQILVSVVANLVQNALKFSHPGGHVAIRASTLGERVLIEVEDECGGLPKGKIDELFLPFAQRGKNTTGLGLGLAISLKGVRSCGGEIRVRDKPGVGCVFTVDLPIAKPGPERSGGQSGTSRLGTPR